VSLARDYMLRMSVLVASSKTFPSDCWTTFMLGPLNSVTASMRPRNFSPTTESGLAEPKVSVSSLPRMPSITASRVSC
jgi:hypothetical protein